MSTERDRVDARKEIRKERRKREKADARARAKVEHQLAADGVMGRVEALKVAVGRPAVVEEIQREMLKHEGSKGAIKDYDTLRAVVSTALSIQGFDLRGVMLKFTWDGKDLSIFVTPSIEAVKAAAAELKMDEETAFRGMLSH